MRDDAAVERFLSPAWFEMLRTDVGAVGGDDGSGGAPDLVLEQRVTGTPDGTVSYQVIIAGGRATISPGSRAGADMTFTSDYATASGIATGRLSLEQAMAGGRLRIAGNLARLQESQVDLVRVDAMAGVRERTAFAAADEAAAAAAAASDNDAAAAADEAASDNDAAAPNDAAPEAAAPDDEAADDPAGTEANGDGAAGGAGRG